MSNMNYAILFILLVLFAGNASAVEQNWSTKQNGNILEIAYGSDVTYNQYAALHLDSSYFRMVYGPESVWGTSVILAPSFWENGKLLQGAPISHNLSYDGDDLLIHFSGQMSNLGFGGDIRMLPPSNNQLIAEVNLSTSGYATLDSNREGEAFQPMKLSSMHISADKWDAQMAYAGSNSTSIPKEGWIIHPPQEAELFGLVGGSNAFKTNAPTIEIVLENPMPITGWVNLTDNENDDNIGFWAASDVVMPHWNYTIISKPYRSKDEIGVFRNGPWYLDYNGNNTWDPAFGDISFWFGTNSDIPLAGDWNGDDKDEIGVFRNGAWYLDYNGNRVWDPTSGDGPFWFGTGGDLPLAGDWNGDGKDEIGVFRNGPWYLDYNGNRVWDPTSGDVSFWFGTDGDMPIAGDWNGDGKDEIGVFRNGPWYLDHDGNRLWDPTSGDVSFWFGAGGDMPFAGDWNGDGKDEIGVFRNGPWYLDYNGNKVWDPASGDISFWFGASGDRPIEGRWS